MGFKGCGMNMV